MIQYYQILIIKKPQNPKYVVAMLNPDLPNVICAFQSLEIFSWHDVNLLYQIKNKGNLFKLFVCKRIKIFLDRTFICFGSIKFDFSHVQLFAYMRTIVKYQ